VITLVREVAALASCSDGILRPAQENGSLSDVERSRAILEHLWNTNVVDGWGSLVNPCLVWCYAARMIWLGW
jgi:hypothetical protein